jgi:protein-tyrosine phosphatase
VRTAATADWISLDGAVNVRTVIPGALLRSDNLQSLTSQDVRRLIDEESVEVVIDLRTDMEVELEGPGPMTAEPTVRIEHRSLYPDSGSNTDLELDTIKPWKRPSDSEFSDEAPVARAYLSYLGRRPDSIVGSIRTIARAEGTVLVHCAAGKDRTGVVIALALDAAGVDRDVIVSDYLATGDRIERIMERLASSSTYRSEVEGHDPRSLAPAPGVMERVLEIVDDRFGGTVAWLSANGLDQQDLELLRRRLRPDREQADGTRGA